MADTIPIPPALRVAIDLKDEFPLAFSLRSTGGGPSSTLELRDNDTVLGQWQSAAAVEKQALQG